MSAGGLGRNEDVEEKKDIKDDDDQGIAESIENIWKKKYYFIAYGVVFLFLGVFFSLPSVLFNHLMEQLSVDEEKMGSLYSYFAISGVISCISSGIVVKKVPKIHYLMAFFCVLGSVVISLIYFVDNFIFMVIIWIILAAVQYFIEVSIIVLVFRVFNIDAAFLVSFYYFIATISSAIVAPLFNAFNTNSNYSYSMFILAAFGVIATVLLLIVPSPKQSDLIRDVETIKKDMVNNNIREIQDIEQFKKDNTKLTYTKTIVYRYSAFSSVQCECARNPAIINELNEVYNTVSNPNDPDNNILYNLFISISYSIRPYSSVTYDDTHPPLTTNPMDDSYWWDFEQKRKKKKAKGDDLSPKRKNITNLFAIIAVANMLATIIHRVNYNAFIVEVASEHFLLGESTGYYLITTQWIGAIFGRVITLFAVQKFIPENVLLFFSSWMVLNSILYVITLFIGNGIGTEILLYIVAFQTGCAPNPLHVAYLAFLSHIQPITGVLSAAVMIAETSGRGIAALLSAFIIEETGLEAQIYIHLATALITLSLMVINKIRYIYFVKQ